MNAAPDGSRVVVDIGNSRLKWARIGHAGEMSPAQAIDLDERDAWVDSLRSVSLLRSASVAIASVNPPALSSLERKFGPLGIAWHRVYASAADVPIRSDLTEPARAGADRALAVLGAWGLLAPSSPGLVVSCGTAITVERVSADGVWEGGAIAPGLSLSARSLHRDTAQLPLVRPGGEVPAWGGATESALAAGIWWGTVGAVRELVSRQGERRWIAWTGGDAEVLSAAVSTPGVASTLLPDLVLRGLAIAAFGIDPEALRP